MYFYSCCKCFVHHILTIPFSCWLKELVDFIFTNKTQQSAFCIKTAKFSVSVNTFDLHICTFWTPAFNMPILVLQKYLSGWRMLSYMLKVQWEVCEYVFKRTRGGPFPLCHLLCSVTPSLNTCSVFSVCLFIPCFSFPSSFKLHFHSVSWYRVRRTCYVVLAHNLGHSGSCSLHSCIPLLCFSSALYFGFWLVLCIIPPFWLLREQSASDWGGWVFIC